MTEPETLSTAKRIFTYTTGDGEPDFTVYSSVDADVEFRVQRIALIAGSEVFADMFNISESSWVDVDGKTLDNISTENNSMTMSEDTPVLENLFRVIHEPPVKLPTAKDMKRWHKLPDYDERKAEGPPIAKGDAVPFPLLKRLFVLADKYIFTPAIVETLHTHLASHATDSPLQVYAMATAMGIDDVAIYASTQLHSPPLETYTPDQMAILPTIQSLQLLYILHAVRKQRLREILAEEQLFPSGYGKCTVKGHVEMAEEAWRKQKRILLSMGRIQAGANLRVEMMPVLVTVSGCNTCLKAYETAIDMIQYKSVKIPQSIANLEHFVPSKQTTAAMKRLVI
ncbi:SubName: Full=Uncharacterized protein {ECO:0000313/EMBL:CCA74244.1} [Serendipita indica DSM 11827]|nr:SubName: Full=Uncharacterized protein {ECO:0000313/EMBL:CCA74244.1} [Serendipita indica DSM 11827]